MSLILNPTQYVGTDTDYTLGTVTAKTTRVHNTGTSTITITFPELDTYLLKSGEMQDFWYDGSATHVVSSGSGSGGGEGLPNYLVTQAYAFTVDTGFTVANDLSTPIDLNGSLIVNKDAADRNGTGFYQDAIISKIDQSSVLQLAFEIASDNVNDLSVKILDEDDSEAVLYDEVISNIAVKNFNSGIWTFSDWINTSANANLRVYFYVNNTSTSAMEWLISGVSLGEPYRLSIPNEGLRAGQLKYDSAETPVDGKNSLGHLCLNGSTFNWSDYHDLYEDKDNLVLYLTDNEDGTFTTRKLSNKTGWTSNSTWALTSFSFNHGVGMKFPFLRVKFLLSATGSDDDSFEIIDITRKYSSTSVNEDTARGLVCYNTDENNIIIYTATYGVNYINPSGGLGSLSTETYYYNIVVERPDAPPEGSYAYIIPTHQRTIDLVKKQTSRDDAGEMFYKTEVSNVTTGLDTSGNPVFDSSFTHSWSDFPELEAQKTRNEGIYTHDNGDGTFHLMDLKYDTGWVLNSDWTNLRFTVTHNLGLPLTKLRVLFSLSTDGTEANAMLFDCLTRSFDSASPSAVDQRSGYMTYAINDNSFEIQTGADGLLLLTKGTGGWTAIISNSYYYKVVVERPDAPVEGSYAYLRTKSLSTLIMAELAGQSGYLGTIYNGGTYDISTADATLPWSKYELGGTEQKKVGFTVEFKWNGGDGTYECSHDSSGLFYNKFFQSGKTPGDGSTTHAFCGHGDGGLIGRLRDNLTDWDILTEDCFDVYLTGTTNQNGYVYQYSNGDRIYEGWDYIQGDGSGDQLSKESTLPITLNNVKKIMGTAYGYKNTSAPATKFDLSGTPGGEYMTVGYNSSSPTTKVLILLDSRTAGGTLTATVYWVCNIQTIDKWPD